MGIDLEHGGRRVGHKQRKAPASQNIYIKLLVKLYRFLARRTNANFNKVVLRRLMLSRTNKPPMGLARVARYMKGKEDKICVIVGTVTDDVRLQGMEFPKLRVCALRVTEGARARIEKAGGEVITFDQLAMLAPTGANTVLLRGRRTARKANKHFGTPGQPGSKTRYVLCIFFSLLCLCGLVRDQPSVVEISVASRATNFFATHTLRGVGCMQVVLRRY
eukprot:gb/GECG01014784.1/.p1 GENE.gb/GECG01014784.1/~~gb/GECG01014784.1/.p1  ORF type:complete len:219 (+),score=17.13 gb/GECG01014784.1/:1-657(+)